VAGTHNRLVWYLRQIEGPGDPDLVVEFGRAGDIPVVGDWNGNGVHTVGVVRGNRWLLRDSNNSGAADYDIAFGQAGDIPVVGDWNGDGRTGPETGMETVRPASAGSATGPGGCATRSARGTQPTRSSSGVPMASR
jgi:hypothetical protein